MVIVLAAFFASGGLNAGTPLAIASTPVSATEPPAKALSSRKTVRTSVPGWTAWGCGGMAWAVPVSDVRQADRDDPDRERHEEIGREGEDQARLAEAAEVADRDQGDRYEGDLDPEVIRRRDDRLDLLDRRRGRHGHGHDVVDEQRCRGHEPRGLGEVLPGHDVRAPARRVGATDLPVADRHHGEQERDRDRDLDRQGERGDSRDHEDAQDLLGGVGGGRDGVRAEDRKGELLREPLLDLLLVRERTPEEHPAGVRPGQPEPACAVRLPPPWR